VEEAAPGLPGARGLVEPVANADLSCGLVDGDDPLERGAIEEAV
jgi:hypothetical protein